MRKETGLRKLWIPLTIYVGGPGVATSRPQMSSVIRDAPEYSLKFICLAVAAKHEYLAAILFNSKYIGCVFCVFILFLVVVTKTGLRYLFRRVCSEARIFLQ